MHVAPADDWLAWRRSVDAALAAEHRAPKLVAELPYPVSPYGGTAAPTALWLVASNHGSFDGSQASQPWLSRMGRLAHAGIAATVPYQLGVATGQVRLRLLTGALNVVTNAITLSSGSTGEAVFRWLHGIAPWDSGEAFLYVEARRTSGAGDVLIGYPYITQVDPTDCTTTGV